MNKACGYLLNGLLALTMTGQAMTTSEMNILQNSLDDLHREGNFSQADALVQQHLAEGDGLSPEDRRALEFELERSRRIQIDYWLTEDRLRESLKTSVKDVTDEEIDGWISEGKFDRLMVDGTWRYVGPSRSNLFFRHPDIRARRIDDQDSEWTNYLLDHSRQVRSEISQAAQMTGNDRNFRITMTITVKPDQVPAGETIRVWMPYPQQFQAQSNVTLLESSPAVAYMNAPDYPQRTLYFEAPSNGAEETIFQATYEMTTQPRRIEIDPELVIEDPAYYEKLQPYFLAENPPHVVFSDSILALAEEIVGDETNPAVKARLIYDWISSNKKYSYAREYSTLRCIPEYVLENGYGDCGQIALTYITLCRAVGIPARWQSGWIIYPIARNLHDWTEIYLAPYGWVPVDPDYAMGFQQSHGEELTPEALAELQDFYFGGMDAYRLTANRDHGFPHFPPKEDFRSDTVDSQRGEVEAGGKNLYYGQFSYKLAVEYLDDEDGDSATSDTARPSDPQTAR